MTWKPYEEWPAAPTSDSNPLRLRGARHPEVESSSANASRTADSIRAELLIGQLREEQALALGEPSLVLHLALDEQPLAPIGHLAHRADPLRRAVVALDHPARGAHAGGVNEAHIGHPEARQQRGVPDGPHGRTIRISPLPAASLRGEQNSYKPG
ncbi:MAG: hypothetical protein KA978_05340 [Deltaproteobacteria bacterium]|nr:hypothetical protein [Deltaproteobacteria bacterium]